MIDFQIPKFKLLKPKNSNFNFKLMMVNGISFEALTNGNPPTSRSATDCILQIVAAHNNENVEYFRA